MSELLVLSEDDVRSVLSLDELAESLTAALCLLSAGSASVPSRIAALSGAGLLGAMPGYVPGQGLAAKLVSVFPSNVEVPTHHALIAVFDDATGVPTALMGATYITAIRTAMTSALAAGAVARRPDGPLAIIGAGVQGAAHLEAFAHLLGPAEIRIASRHHSRARALAESHPTATAMSSAQEAVRGATVVCCCTDAREAVLASDWITSGVHVSSVGTGAELPRELLARSRVFVESRAATQPPPAGAIELQGLEDGLVEIGDVLAGRATVRVAHDEISVFKSTGNAVEDVAAANLVLSRARRLGVGISVEMSAIG